MSIFPPHNSFLELNTAVVSYVSGSAGPALDIIEWRLAIPGTVSGWKNYKYNTPDEGTSS